jgi:GNAT superfamily N-acetyltransferase
VHAARPATTADLDELVAIAELAVDEMTVERGGQIWARTIGRRPPFEPELRAAIEDPARLLLCGLLSGSVVGYAAARIDELPDGALLAVVEDLFALPEARHVGVGEVMMDTVLEWATDRGAIGIDALALPGMRDTKNFFERFGLVARAIVVHRSLR